MRSDLVEKSMLAVVETDQEATANRISVRTTLSWLWWKFSNLAHTVFGVVSLVFLLSVLATLPILQFLSLGYFLEASARVARSKRIRSGIIGINEAARVGSIAIGTFLSLLPLKLFSSLWYSSYLLNGDAPENQRLRVLVVLLGFATLLHVGWAVYRGGKFRHFMWPAPLRLWRTFRAGGMYHHASHALANFVGKLRLPYYFGLGLRGFIGASIWLFIPISLMAAATSAEDPGFGGLVAVVGGLLLAWVLTYLPFLQIRLPLTGRFRSQFELRSVRHDFACAPIAYWFSFLMTLALAVPLYVLKAELVPREAAWLPSVFFVMFMFPARLVVGWSVGRSERRETSRHWFFRWFARLGMIPIALIYALIVYFTQFTSWYGSWSLYEQHAFLVPVPFLGF